MTPRQCEYCGKDIEEGNTMLGCVPCVTVRVNVLSRFRPKDDPLMRR